MPSTLQTQRVPELRIEIVLNHLEGHTFDPRSQSFYGRLPELIVPRRGEKVMTGPGHREEVSLRPGRAYGMPPVGWKEERRLAGFTEDNLALEEIRFYHHGQVLTYIDTVCGWIFDGAITLVKEQEITDQVGITFHNLTILAVFADDFKVTGVRFCL